MLSLISMLSLMLAFFATASAQVLVCFPPIGVQAPLGFFMPNPSALPHKALLLLSPDSGTWWDKSCGYSYHASCFPPWAISATLPAQNMDIGAPVTLVTVGGQAYGVGVFPVWYTTPLDENARYIMVNLLPAQTMQANPFSTYADMWGHNEPWTTPEATTPYIFSVSGPSCPIHTTACL
jgi:hypothetical protein